MLKCSGIDTLTGRVIFMAYMALYRKWRPNDFDEVQGQDAIVRTLRNEILYDRIGHAYLFCGTRGTGKTSIAKLFAKAVNCQHPVDAIRATSVRPVRPSTIRVLWMSLRLTPLPTTVWTTSGRSGSRYSTLLLRANIRYISSTRCICYLPAPSMLF